GGQEVRFQQEVLGRVAVHRKLREDRELSAALTCIPEVFADPGRIALDAADRRIDLREGNSHWLSDRCHYLDIKNPSAAPRRRGPQRERASVTSRYSALPLLPEVSSSTFTSSASCSSDRSSPGSSRCRTSSAAPPSTSGPTRKSSVSSPFWSVTEACGPGM